MKELQAEKPALALADHGFRVFPLSPNSKVPLKGTHGYKDATNDLETVFSWIIAEPRMNLGLSLDSLLVVDIDIHDSEHNGRESLLKLAKKGYQLPTNTYIEQTPSGGLHYFFKYDGKPTRKVNILDGIDLLTDFAVISPSEVNGKPYKPIGKYQIKDAAPAPQWLINMMKPDEKPSNTKLEIKFPSRKKYMGKLLDEIVAGTEVGNRNEWLTQLAGKLIWTGADAPTVYNMMCFANENLSQPISDKELNVIFRSIVNKERRVAN
jgi:hypothetical protein